MSTTITIPAPLVKEIREATQSSLCLVAYEIARQTERRNPELSQPFADFDAQRAMFEALPDDALAARVGIEHVRVMAENLRDQARSIDGVMNEALAAHRVTEADECSARLDSIAEFIDGLFDTVKTSIDGGCMMAGT